MLITVLALTLSGISSPLQSVEGRHQTWVSGGFASTWALQLGGGFQLAAGWRLDVQLDTQVNRRKSRILHECATIAAEITRLGEVHRVGTLREGSQAARRAEFG